MTMTEFVPYAPTPGSTLSVYSKIDRHDPRAARDMRPFAIGEYVIRRLPMRGTLHISYYILHQGAVVGHQISYPSEDDCRTHHRRTSAAPGDRHHAPRTPAPMFGDVTLKGRILAVLALREMDLATLAATLCMAATKLYQVLEELAAERRIFRRGTRHRYTYRVA